eukprot:3629779-Amphidinium_carterae.5
MGWLSWVCGSGGGWCCWSVCYSIAPSSGRSGDDEMTTVLACLCGATSMLTMRSWFVSMPWGSLATVR